MLSPRMRNADGQGQTVIVLGLIHRCTDACIHHHTNRTVECIEKKANVLNQTHHLALPSDHRWVILLLKQSVYVLLRSTDVQIMLNDVLGCVDAIGFILKPKQTTRMTLGQIRTANEFHILLRQSQQP